MSKSRQISFESKNEKHETFRGALVYLSAKKCVHL